MSDRLHRRDFTKLTAAAFGGVAMGFHYTGPEALASEYNPEILLSEPHVCKGLNACKGKGGCSTGSNDCTGKNECAGMGGCPTAEQHSCRGENTCKGQGGCGEHPGQNACNGKGDCAVPLSAKAWKNARRDFEKAMKAAERKFGPAPENAPGKKKS